VSIIDHEDLVLVIDSGLPWRHTVTKEDRRMESLADRQEIVDLTIAYSWALDSRRYDDLDRVFVPDATAELGWPLRGRDAIKARIAEALNPLDSSQHMIGTQQIHLDGDRATGRTYLHAQHVKRGMPGGELFMVAGSYADRFVRTPDGWRIEHRSLTVLWTEGNPAVMHRGK
jgi:hypothetical protein